MLEHADLRKADLTSAILDGADLDSANLKRARLNNASLMGTAMNSTDLTRADLRGAELISTALNAADLTRVEGAMVTSSGFNDNVYKKTIRPDGSNSNDNGGTCAGHF